MEARQAAHEAWLARAEPEPRLIPPDLRVIDPHHHLWYAHPTRKASATFMLRELSADIAGAGDRVVATCYMQSSSAGWTRTVPPDTAPPPPPGHEAVAETEVMHGVAALSKHGRYGPTLVNAAIVATADLTLGAAVEPLLDAHAAASPNFRGVRYLGGKAEHIPFESASVRAALAVLERRGWVLDCNGPETHPLDFDGVLGEKGLLGVAQEFPHLQIVLDHCGGAIGPTALAEEGKREEWARCLAGLAQCPNVAVKVGGLQMEVNGFPIGPDSVDRPVSSQTLADLTSDLYAHTIKVFGPARCMFESNFPVDRWGTSYGNLWNCFWRVADTMALSRVEREQLFAGTAARVYRLDLERLDRWDSWSPH